MAEFRPTYADLSAFQNGLGYRANAQNPLDAILGSVQQGIQLQQLPQTLRDQALARQLNNAIAQEKLFAIQNPQAAAAMELEKRLTLEGALNQDLGLFNATRGLGTIGTPGAITATQQAALPSNEVLALREAAALQGGVNVPTVLPTAQAGLPITEVAPFGIPTGVYKDPNAVLAANQREQDSSLGKLREELTLRNQFATPKTTSLVFREDDTSFVGLHPITGEVITRTPKVQGEDYRVITGRGLFKITTDKNGNKTETLVPGSGPIQSGNYTPQQLNSVNQLYDRFNRNDYVKKAQVAEASKDIILQGLSQNNSVGDIAAINQFQSGMVDPGATVREGDVDLILRASPVLARVQNYLPKLAKGGVLPPEVRNEMRKLSIDIYNMRARNANDIPVQQFKGMSEKAGIDFQFVGQEFNRLNEDGTIAQNPNTQAPVTSVPVVKSTTLSSNENFPSEEAARAAGHQNGELLIINGVKGNLE